ILLCMIASLGLWNVASAADTKKVLFFSKSSGFEHAVIKQKDGQPSFGEKILTEKAPKLGVEFTFSKDGSLFTPEYLAKFDAYMFYTTGDLTKPRDLRQRGDDNPLMTAAGKEALLKAISQGKGFVGIHSASDTFHSPGDDEDGAARYTANGAGADPYIKMLGGEFIRHGAQQAAKQIVADAKFP